MTLSIPASSGVHGNDWPSNFVFPQGIQGSLSMAGWTDGNEGFQHQTFLGASIRNFDLNAGFGDTTSTMTVALVNDEYNKSDGTPLGQGDDPYHSGVHDNFKPPVASSPVFFKYGKNFATVEQAYRKTLDDIYGYDTFNNFSFDTTTTDGEFTEIPGDNFFQTSNVSGERTWEDRSPLLDSGNAYRGSGHFVFGGILQSYTETKGSDGSPLFNVTISDPREVLSNAVLILNDYAGTTYNNKNLLNVYGFLEYDPSDALKNEMENLSVDKSILTKVVDPITADVSYAGRVISNDIATSGSISTFGADVYRFNNNGFNISNFPNTFPITGQSFARRSDQGIPVYRVLQGLSALFQYEGNLPNEYQQAGFGGAIDFRGYKYVVDFSGIPTDKIPSMYFVDYNQIDLLSFCQELCDVISHDLFVSLLPVVNHPAYDWLYQYNQYHINNGTTSEIITGVIRVDAIDRSFAPSYGSIQNYIEDLRASGVDVINSDVGFEASNVVTDKFVVGAQEVQMHYFTNNKDRDNLQLRRLQNGLDNTYELQQGEQWLHETSLKQQILPFYGFLGKDAVTIPRGFGAYQQIMLDSTGLDAFGVGNYYVTTEMELRHAAVSYQSWVKFLMDYNERYMTQVDESAILNPALKESIDTVEQAEAVHGLIHGEENPYEGQSFAVDVPRCVFMSDRNHMGEDGLPASPCAPPYGYPLYFKRAEKIGIPQAGFADIVNARTTLVSAYERAKDLEARFELEIDGYDRQIAGLQNSLSTATNEQKKSINKQIAEFQEDRTAARTKLEELQGTTLGPAGYLEGKTQAIKDTLEGNANLVRSIDRLGREVVKNSLKVYNFLRDIADRYLGKQFLVKIPQSCNLNYNKFITTYNDNTNNIATGPFGFAPQPVNTEFSYSASDAFQQQLAAISATAGIGASQTYEHYLDQDSAARYSDGALRVGYNPISEKWEYNYTPEPQGGFFNFALYDRNFSFVESLSLSDSQLPPATEQMLCPRDLTNFVNDNGRVSAYVRYDHSENLDLSSLSRGSFAQQRITKAGIIPDVMEEIGNTTADNLQTLDGVQRRLDQQDFAIKDAVTYVKCDMEPRFFHPVRTSTYSIPVYGRKVQTVPLPTVKKTIRTTDDDGCPEDRTIDLYNTAYFVPAASGGAEGDNYNVQDFARRYDPLISGNMLITQQEELDPNHTYALIRLPSRIIPTTDYRFVDGPMQAVNTPRLKNLLTADVVRGVPGFDKPSPVAKSRDLISELCANEEFGAEFLNNTFAAYNNFLGKIALGLPEYGSVFSSPSPVYPDMVALPLLSKERAYGPWLSSSIQNLPGDNVVRLSNIGGKTEFIKDENLAPWNYAGYQLLNEAGSLQAQFSNSQLLFSERGGFVMSEIPTGISLAKSLVEKGPLVTSVSMSFNNEIRTTVKMDLYTPRYGKLQKQKEIAISRAARERQRIIDERNQSIRNGLSKSTGANMMSDMYSRFDEFTSQAESFDKTLTNFEKGTTTPDRIVFSVVDNKITGSDSDGNSNTVSETGVRASIQDETLFYQAREIAPTSRDSNLSHYNSAGGTFAEVFQPYSNDIYHPRMVSKKYTNPQSDLGDF